MKGSLRLMFLCCSVFGLGCGDASESSPPKPDPDTTPAPPAIPSGLRPPAISGGTLAVLADGSAAVVSDGDRDQISVVDLGSKTVRRTIMLRPGDEPGRVVEDAAGRVHVVLRGGDALASFDPSGPSELRRRQVCSAPRGIAFDGQRNLLHVACADGQLLSLTPEGETPSRRVRLERDLRDLVVVGDVIFVTTFRQAVVLKVDAVTGALLTRAAPPKMRAALPRPPLSTPDSRLSSPSVAWRMVAAPDGTPMVLHQRGAEGTISIAPGGYGDGHACSGIVEAAVTRVESTSAELRLTSSRALARTVLPVDLAISPDGRQLAVVAAGNGSSGALLFVPMQAAEASAAVGTGVPGLPDCELTTPAPLPSDPETAPDPVVMPMPPLDTLPEPVDFRPPNGEVVAVAFDPKGNVLVQSRNPASLQILTQRVAPITLSTENRYDLGHQIFHRGTSGQVACASCHPEGAEDSRTWTFESIGVRRTQSLRGGIMETAPFHWDGDLADMDHLMADVFQTRMGGKLTSSEDIEALGAWIDQLPTTAVARGKAIFMSAEAGCSTCHAGSKLTNNTSADVGTGSKLQTPQLMGLALRAPYMHDGCAATLEARFRESCGGGDRHGVTSHLTAAQLDDLVKYLETL